MPSFVIGALTRDFLSGKSAPDLPTMRLRGSRRVPWAILPPTGSVWFAAAENAEEFLVLQRWPVVAWRGRMRIGQEGFVSAAFVQTVAPAALSSAELEFDMLVRAVPNRLVLGLRQRRCPCLTEP